MLVATVSNTAKQYAKQARPPNTPHLMGNERGMVLADHPGDCLS